MIFQQLCPNFALKCLLICLTELTSTSPKGEVVDPGIKQLPGKAQYFEFV